jgi:hypothetical protein
MLNFSFIESEFSTGRHFGVLPKLFLEDVLTVLADDAWVATEQHIFILFRILVSRFSFLFQREQLRCTVVV